MANLPSFDNPCRNNGKRLVWDHLGGTSTSGDPNSWEPNLWAWILESFQPRSVLDVGCGVGFAQKFFHDAGLNAIGLDCEQIRPYHLLPDQLIMKDLTTGAWISEHPFDLIWSCECAEHVDSQFLSYLLDTLVKNCGKVLAFCAAPPEAVGDGFHHVNCQQPAYWIDHIQRHGLRYNESLTVQAKTHACGLYFRRSGLIFLRE